MNYVSAFLRTGIFVPRLLRVRIEKSANSFNFVQLPKLSFEIMLYAHFGFIAAFLLPAAGLWANTDDREELDRFLSELNSDKIVKYVDLYKHIAVAEMQRSGVPASIKMAQGILESGSGESELARKANNHFGIKCGGDWTGPTYYVWDDEPVKSCFRVYANAEECYRAHTDFLTNPAKEYRYGFLFQLNRTDYKAWANGLQKAGYATSQTYAVKLISLIERYELYKLDHLGGPIIAVTDDEMERTFGYPPRPLYETPADTAQNTARISIPDPFHEGANVEVTHLTTDIFELYGLKTVFIQKGDDVATVARRYGVSVKQLEKYNELSKGYTLQAGRYLFLQAKHKTYQGSTPTHALRSDETLYDVAQRYGVQLKTLQRKNKAYAKKTPPEGSRIALK